MIFESHGPLGEKFDFFSPLEFDIQRDSDPETSNQALLNQSFKRYLNEEDLIHSREIGTI